MISALFKRIFLIAGCTVIAGGLALGVTYYQGANERAGQQAANTRLGAAATLCQGKDQAAKPSGNAAVAGKVGIINGQDGTLFDQYDQALPATLRPQQPSEVASVLCLFEVRNVFGTDKYGKGSSTDYTCTRSERDLDGWLVDAKTGKVLAFGTFVGQTPPECPNETDHSLTVTGDLPLPSDITDWLTQTSGFST